MPLMREWTEITVDEDLLIPVVRELLDMAVNPNQVEIVHGPNGRVILAEVHLAEHWYQERLKRDSDEVVVEDDFVSQVQTEVVAAAEIAQPEVVAPAEIVPPKVVVPAVVPPARIQAKATASVAPAPVVAPAAVPPPVKRVLVPKPSASLDGEEQ